MIFEHKANPDYLMLLSEDRAVVQIDCLVEQVKCGIEMNRPESCGYLARLIFATARHLEWVREFAPLLQGDGKALLDYVISQAPSHPVADSLKDRLFSGCYPEGIAYSDRGIEVKGDYKRIAFLSYWTLELKINDTESPLLDLVREDAAKIQAMRGQPFQVSACGQTVILGQLPAGYRWA